MNRRASSRKRADVAIVGMACRFPGAESVEQYWELLSTGRCAVRELPPERWDVDDFFSADSGEAGKTNTRKGGYIEGPDRFDAGFFGVSPREARRMDPQQRILLEVAWHALEDANIVPGTLAGSHTGVFIGVMGCEWGRLQFADIKGIDGLTGPGSHDCISPNRVSYHFDLKGPSVAYATACSSSLVSIHAAIRSLQFGECPLAIAGGVNLVMHPGMILFYTKAGLAAPNGVCKPFSRYADGLGRSDGVGVVVLKLLSEAVAAGDRIYAIIRGGAVNQDGRSNGLTAPSRAGQEDLLHLAFGEAEVAPAEIQYVETHGTGTVLGDLIEARALGGIMASRPPEAGPCYIGSVKGNISHLEGAAGVASVIKVALALKYGKIPASLHSAELNPEIPFDEYRLAVPQRVMDWPDTGAAPRMAGVSAFGIGGTNAHLVLAGPPSERPIVASPAGGLPSLLCLTAKSEAALRSYAQHLDDFLDRHPQVDLPAFCNTWNAFRSHFATRAALVCSSVPQLRKELRAYSRNSGSNSADLIVASVGRKEPRVAFAFTGQGAQYVGMGRALYHRVAAFRQLIDEREAGFARLTGHSLKNVLFDDASLQQRAGCMQPAYFVLGCALAALWRSWGVQPACVFGHSLGEYAAAFAAGRLGFDEGLRLVAKRGALMEALDPGGSMLAVDASAEALGKRLADWGSNVVIGADNAPTMSTLSGPKDELERIKPLLVADGHHLVPLAVAYAFHSPQMEPIMAEFEAFADTLAPGAPIEQISFLSNVSGREVDHHMGLDGRYWASQVRQPVRFRACVLEAHRRGCNIFLEIGPGAMLGGLIQATLGGPVWTLASLDRNKDDYTVMLRAIGELYCRGVTVDLRRGMTGSPRSLADLPKYPFQHQSYPLAVVDPAANPACKPTVKPDAEIAPARASPLPSASASTDVLASGHGDRDDAGIIRTAVAKICGMDVKAIDPAQRLVDDLGFSSIMLAELVATLREKIPPVTAIPLSFYFSGGSIGEMLQQCGVAPAGAATAANRPRDLSAALARCEIWASEFDPKIIRRVPRHWVHQHREDNVLLARHERLSPAVIMGEAARDLAHPFFFDHAQDHVPGMYVIEAVRQLITASAHAYFGVGPTRKFVLTEMNSQFAQFVELDRPFFMVSDHTTSHFNDGTLTYIDCITHIVQEGVVVGQVQGRGRVMEAEEYLRARGGRGKLPASADSEGRLAEVG